VVWDALEEVIDGGKKVRLFLSREAMIKYLLEGMPLKQWGIRKGALLAASIPLVLGVVLWLTRRIKHRLIKQPEHELE